MLFWLLLALSLLSAALYMCIGAGKALTAVLLAAGAFLALNLIYVAALWVVGLFADKRRPLEKQNSLCRLGCAGVAELIDRYSGVRAHISGTEKLPTDERFLLVCNHRSMYDPLVIIDKLRSFNISFISKPSNMEIPIAGKLAYGAGYLAIDRENDRNALKTILQAADYLKRGICSVAIYPEGTRNEDSELLPFHAGSFKIAQRAGASIAITAVYGTEKVKNNLFRRVTDVYFEVLEVIPAEQVKAMSTAELAEYSRSLIEARLSAVS